MPLLNLFLSLSLLSTCGQVKLIITKITTIFHPFHPFVQFFVHFLLFFPQVLFCFFRGFRSPCLYYVCLWWFFGVFFWQNFIVLTTFFDNFLANFFDKFFDKFIKRMFWPMFWWPIIFKPLQALGSEYLRSCLNL